MNMRALIAWLIALVWAATYTRKVIDPSFPVPAEITPVMILVAGYLFGKDISARFRGKGKDE